MSICKGKLKSTKQMISHCFKYRKTFFFFNLAIPKKNHTTDGLIIVLMVNVSTEEISIYARYTGRCFWLKQWVYKLMKSKIKFLSKPIK